MLPGCDELVDTFPRARFLVRLADYSVEWCIGFTTVVRDMVSTKSEWEGALQGLTGSHDMPEHGI